MRLATRRVAAIEPLFPRETASVTQTPLSAGRRGLTQPAVLSIIQKLQACLMPNIGHEVGDDQVDAGPFLLGYTGAMQTLRGAGILAPLAIDAATWGQNLDILDSTAVP
jgi:mannan endo-1,4-beta-mannosidase